MLDKVVSQALQTTWYGFYYYIVLACFQKISNSSHCSNSLDSLEAFHYLCFLCTNPSRVRLKSCQHSLSIHSCISFQYPQRMEIANWYFYIEKIILAELVVQMDWLWPVIYYCWWELCFLQIGVLSRVNSIYTSTMFGPNFADLGFEIEGVSFV